MPLWYINGTLDAMRSVHGLECLDGRGCIVKQVLARGGCESRAGDRSGGVRSIRDEHIARLLRTRRRRIRHRYVCFLDQAYEYECTAHVSRSYLVHIWQEL